MYPPADDCFNRSLPPVPGAAPIRLHPAGMNGIWTLSFSRFGWQDYEGRGAVIRLEDGLVFGGGSNSVYRGTCTMVGNAIEINLDVDRYRADPDFATNTGIKGGDHFHMHCIADPLSPDHFEGRVSGEGRASAEVLPEVRMTMRRFAPM